MLIWFFSSYSYFHTTTSFLDHVTHKMDDYVVKIYVHTDEREISFLVIILLQAKYEMVDAKTSNHWYAIPAGVS